MKLLWGSVLAGALIMLAALALRGRLRLSWIGYAFVHLTAAALLLYVVDATGLLGEYGIPMNAATVAVVGVLGVPGLAAMAAVKWALM